MNTVKTGKQPLGFLGKALLLPLYLLGIPFFAVFALLASVVMIPLVGISAFAQGDFKNGLLCMIFLTLLLLLLPFFTCAAPFFILFWAATGSLWEEGLFGKDPEKERDSEHRQSKASEDFRIQYCFVNSLSPADLSPDAVESFTRAKKLIIDSTTEFCDDCPGEAKSMLREAIYLIQDHGKFGRELGMLIDKAIDYSYLCSIESGQTRLHQMLWDCARLITLKFGGEKSGKKG